VKCGDEGKEEGRGIPGVRRLFLFVFIFVFCSIPSIYMISARSARGVSTQ